LVAHAAFTVQVPVPLFIVTKLPATVQTLAVVDIMVGVTPEFCVVATVKVDTYAALAGAPVKVTVGATFVTVATAVTGTISCGAAE
jgi:hypothetical protein